MGRVGSDGGQDFPASGTFTALGEADLDGNTRRIVEPEGAGRTLAFGDRYGRSERHFGKIDAIKRRTQVWVRQMDDGAASSEEPMRFPARSISSAPVTT